MININISLFAILIVQVVQSIVLILVYFIGYYTIVVTNEFLSKRRTRTLRTHIFTIPGTSSDFLYSSLPSKLKT